MDPSHEPVRTEEQMMSGESELALYENRVEPPQFGCGLEESEQEMFRLGEDSDASRMEPSPFSSDYYRELSYVTRGLTLPPVGSFEDPYGTPLQCTKDFGLPAKDFKECQDYGGSAEANPFVVGVSGASPLAQMPFGGLAATSVFLGEATVEDALAWLRKLFTEAPLSGDVLKERLEKGTMTVRVCHQAGHWAAACGIKVRLHRNCSVVGASEGQRGLVAEFQRREGDALAFRAVFQSLKASLELAALTGCVASSTGEAAGVPETPLEDVDAEAVTSDELQPIMDLLQESERPDLQIEAVNALALLLGTASCETAAAVVACHALHSVQGLLCGLLTSPSFDVACPAARLVAMLPADECSPELVSSLRLHSLKAGISSYEGSSNAAHQATAA